MCLTNDQIKMLGGLTCAKIDLFFLQEVSLWFSILDIVLSIDALNVQFPFVISRLTFSILVTWLARRDVPLDFSNVPIR